jgi:hypothetical protein
MCVPDRRRIGLVTVACMQIKTVLAVRGWWGEEGWQERGLDMGQLALSKGQARMGFHYHGQKANIPSKGFFIL